jgi:tetratricopeptide (TPR) repeat protein
MAAAAGAVERFTDLDEPLGRAKALEVMAYFHQRHGRPDEALACLDQALDVSVSGHPDLPSGLWLARGFTLVTQGRYDEAAASYGRALDLSRQHGIRLREAMVLRAMGSLHRRRGDLDAAQVRLCQALEILDGLDHASARASTLLTLGQVRADQGHPDARVTLESALVECHRLDVAFGQALALGALGDVHRSLGRPEVAVAVCTEALAIAERLGEPLLRALTQRSLGAAQHARGDHGAARRAWSTARDLHSAMGNRAEAEELDRQLAG